MRCKMNYLNKLERKLSLIHISQFDPQLTDIMLHLIETGQIDMQRLYDNANVKEEEE